MLFPALPFVTIIGCIASIALANRETRSPGSSGWQGENNYGGLPSVGVARSSHSSWSNSNSRGRSSGYSNGGGWGQSSQYQQRNAARSYPNGNGWLSGARDSLNAYGGASGGWQPKSGGYGSSWDNTKQSSGWGGSVGLRSNSFNGQDYNAGSGRRANSGGFGSSWDGSSGWGGSSNLRSNGWQSSAW